MPASGCPTLRANDCRRPWAAPLDVRTLCGYCLCSVAAPIGHVAKQQASLDAHAPVHEKRLIAIVYFVAYAQHLNQTGFDGRQAEGSSPTIAIGLAGAEAPNCSDWIECHLAYVGIGSIAVCCATAATASPHLAPTQAEAALAAEVREPHWRCSAATSCWTCVLMDCWHGLHKSLH